MTSQDTHYNELSWAIDLIAHIKQIAAQTNRPIKDAGGERTIGAEGGSLFPDVLLFGDKETARILQGWELKMPDTSIDNSRFRRNAEVKARALGLDSFLLWNVSVARLYTRQPSADHFIVAKEWRDLADINARSSVLPNRHRWEMLAERLVNELNGLFDSGSLEGRRFVDAYRSGGITSLILDNYGLVADALTQAVSQDAILRSKLIIWWDKHRAEYAGRTRETALGQAVIANWIGKLMFAHILREKDHRAQEAITIDENTTPIQTLEAFHRLSRQCDFWTIFADSPGLREIPKRTWTQLRQFNRLLSDLRIGSIDQQQLAAILEATVEVARRKVRGQYATPIPLAQLLVTLCLKRPVEDRVLDPCCGSGTISRVALQAKLQQGTSAEVAAASVWAGDQDPQAVQIATLALADSRLMHMPLRVFNEDAFSLTPSTIISFRSPTDGSILPEKLDRFDGIISNLPFVAQNGRNRYGNAITAVNGFLGNDHKFPGRADVAAYLPFSLYPLLRVGGRLGVVITNAWLGTDWGDAFLDALLKYYELKWVITSGARRWFQASEVVTNILVAEKRSHRERTNYDIGFVVLKRPLDEMDEEETQLTAAHIETGQPRTDCLDIRHVRLTDLLRYRKYGLAGNAQFVDCDWIHELPLIRVNNLFRIRRGERRGMNALFYPEGEHGIESEYIRPLIKSPSEFTRLRAQAVREAFACSRSERELTEKGHTGALAWIERYKTDANMHKLRRANLRWFEMDADHVSDLVMFINPGDRLFVGRVDPPAFVDQRMVRLDERDGVDGELCHALMNTAIGMFIIEGLGFGRGLGALDLNKNRIEEYMHMLDPAVLDQKGKEDIVEAFQSLLQRDILGVADELEQDDRRHFDEVVINAFGMTVSRSRVYDTLIELVGIRLCANQ